MSAFDTQPAPLNPHDPSSPWARFRVGDPRRCLAALVGLRTGDVPVSVGVPGGPSFSASLWSVDQFHGHLHFNVGSLEKGVAQTSALPNLWGAAYLDDVKLQFELCQPQLTPRGADFSLRVDLPPTVYMMPRRAAVRVRQAAERMPKARFVHPLDTEQFVELKVLDLSQTGCALWKPAGMLGLQPGCDLRSVEIELNDHEIFFTDIRVHHVTVQTKAPAGSRIGCAWLDLSATAKATLGEWIQPGRRRQQLVSLKFD
jgi:flagellar brake protein